jgi:hypothetical protein
MAHVIPVAAVVLPLRAEKAAAHAVDMTWTRFWDRGTVRRVRGTVNAGMVVKLISSRTLSVTVRGMA